MKAVGAADDQPNARVDGLDRGIRESIFEGRDQRLDVGHDPVGDHHERREPGTEGPAEPKLEQFQASARGS